MFLKKGICDVKSSKILTVCDVHKHIIQYVLDAYCAGQKFCSCRSALCIIHVNKYKFVGGIDFLKTFSEMFYGFNAVTEFKVTIKVEII